MAETIKVLGQSAPSATTLTDIYTVPADTEAVASSITVTNRSSGSDSFRISISIAGAADADEQQLYYDVPITANNTFIATIGVTLAATDVVRCYTTGGNLTFQLFGLEKT